MEHMIAVEFVRSILIQNPEASTFGDIYDAMVRAACTRSFYDFGHEELAMTGISFSLSSTNKLEQLISEARQSLQAETQH